MFLRLFSGIIVSFFVLSLVKCSIFDLIQLDDKDNGDVRIRISSHSGEDFIKCKFYFYKPRVRVL